MSVSKLRLGIAGKIMMVAVCFTLPIGVLLALTVANINEFINFARQETKGNAYQRQLENLMQALQESQIALHGGPGATSDFAASRERIEKAFDAVATANDDYGADLQFTYEGLQKRDRLHVRPALVQGEWRKLAKTLNKEKSQPSPDIDEQYNHLVSDVRTMITHSGDSSNLILDPDLDSYYLMDVTLLALPQTQDRLAKMIAFGRDFIKASSHTPGQVTQLAVHTALLQEADLDRVVASSKTALNEDKNFYGTSPSLQQNLAKALDDYSLKTKRFIEISRQLAESETPSVSAEEFVAAGMQAHQASFRYWDVADTELDVLLQKRVASYTSRRTSSLVLATLAVLVAVGLACVVTLGITRQLESLVRTLGPGATLLSECVHRIAEANERPSSTPEEATIICEELNAHADDMRSAVRKLETLVRGSAALRQSAV